MKEYIISREAQVRVGLLMVVGCEPSILLGNKGDRNICTLTNVAFVLYVIVIWDLSYCYSNWKGIRSPDLRQLICK